ncbi:avidin/streptavidin family protein, partial [Salmonella sp. s51228]|uniref:avidin/streptavidin family protein n=1 Tax=Salmonella sp. s51228 TaxID=3159652 RepID=UPI00397F2D80
FPLVGSYDKDGKAIGWVVSWQKYDSVTTWSGLAFEIGPILWIHTTWLLTSTTSFKDVWSSTQIGQDKFVRAWKGEEATFKYPESFALLQHNCPESLRK